MVTKKSTFARSPLRRLMKRCGATIVARDAVDTLILNLVETTMRLTKQAKTFATHSKRKKISKDDMLLAIKYG